MGGRDQSLLGELDMVANPVFIIGAPRSGTSILYRALSLHPELWHLPRESHAVFEGPFHPDRGWNSNRITASDVTAEHRDAVVDGFCRRVLNLGVLNVDQQSLITDRSLLQRVRNRVAMSLYAARSRRRLPASFRLLEKTPKNSLRVSALSAMFPDARFVFLARNPRENVDSLIAGWRAVDRLGPFRRHRFCAAGYDVTRRLRLADYDGPRWKFALIPGWEQLAGRTVADVAAAQYMVCNDVAQSDLQQVPADRVFQLGFEQFVQEPVRLIRQIFEWADLDRCATAEQFASELPRVNDATPHLKRQANELRFPAEVDRALAAYSEAKAA